MVIMKRIFSQYITNLFTKRNMCTATVKNNVESIEERRKKIMAKGLPKQKPISNVKEIIMVGSGKGGVGKSSVTVNLAIALKENNPDKQIGILDADIYGPSIPLMMNLNESPLLNKDNKMIPLQNYGIKCMSMGFLIDPGKAVVWRGLMVMQALERLMRHVDWGPTDYLLIDTPPGTGDAHLTLLQNLPVSGVVIVTTPQQSSLQVVARSITMFRSMNVQITGLVENMSSVTCPKCLHDFSLYGNRLQDYCKIQNVELLASIPLDVDLSNSSDDGVPIVISKPENKSSVLYKSLANKVLENLNVKDTSVNNSI